MYVINFLIAAQHHVVQKHTVVDRWFIPASQPHVGCDRLTLCTHSIALALIGEAGVNVLMFF